MTDPAFEFAPVGLAELEHRVIRRCNRAFAEIFGAGEHAGRPIAELYPSREEFERIGARGLAAMRETGRYEDERIMRRLNGELFWCRVQGRSLTPADPFRQAIWSFADLGTERPVFDLTPREREVAILTCRGLSAKEVGQRMGLSHRTVEAHRARLMDKTGARKLAELVAKLSGMPL